MLDAPTVGMLGTVAGIGLFVTIIEEVLLRALQWTGAQKDRFGPLLALALGVLLALAGSLTGVVDYESILGAVLTGIASAGVGMGIHDVTTGTVAPDSP